MGCLGECASIASQALQAAGRIITGFALRQRLGGGNPGSLKQVSAEYMADERLYL